MLLESIRKNYSLKIESLDLLDSHFGTEIYLLRTENKKFIVKSLPSLHANLEGEGKVTDFLRERGISVARVLKTNGGSYSVRMDDTQFHVQDFIEGETLAVNTAPAWFLTKSAQTLGRVHQALMDYPPLERAFDERFFDKLNVLGKKAFLTELLNSDEAKVNDTLRAEILGQMKHADKIASFDIDFTKLTFANSHGDFYIGQVITNGDSFTVIDWSSVCNLPICIELMMSYAYAAPECADGTINAAGLREYIQQYSTYSPLSEYDLKIMPYLFYWHQFMTNYTPPFSEVPPSYKTISKLINNLMDWLYYNAGTLASELCI